VGQTIEHRFGSVIVLLVPQKGDSRQCRWYVVKHPSQRVQYANQ
jgi:hypothetical protein